jgi:hypothetical protein
MYMSIVLSIVVLMAILLLYCKLSGKYLKLFSGGWFKQTKPKGRLTAYYNKANTCVSQFDKHSCDEPSVSVVSKDMVAVPVNPNSADDLPEMPSTSASSTQPSMERVKLY